MNTSIVERIAGIEAAMMLHAGLYPRGSTSQPRLSLAVGSNLCGILSFGVLTLKIRSTRAMTIIAIRTAKSDTMERTWGKDLKNRQILTAVYRIFWKHWQLSPSALLYRIGHMLQSHLCYSDGWQSALMEEWLSCRVVGVTELC